MAPFSVRTTLTLADWRAYQKACVARAQGAPRSWQGPMGIVVSAAATAGIFLLFERLGRPLDFGSFLAGLALIIIVGAVSRRKAMKFYRPEEGGVFVGDCKYELGPDGIQVEQQGVRSHGQWSRVKAMTFTTEHLFIWVDSIAGHVVPLRDLPPGMGVDDALARMRAWSAAEVGTRSEPPSIDASIDSAGVQQSAKLHPSTADSKQHRLRSALRLLTLRGADADGLTGSTRSIALLSVFSLVLWVGLDWLRNTPDPKFFPYEAPTLAWFVLAALLSAVAMATRSHPAIGLARVCALVALVVPVLLVADFSIDAYVAPPWNILARCGLALYAMVYCSRGLKGLAGSGQPAALSAGILVAASLLWVSSAVYYSPTLWMSRDALDDVENDTGWESSEAILFEQPARLDASLAAVARPPVDVPVGYFVGFAGYGEQKVFAEEIKTAARVFGERYETSARTVLLINDQRDLKAQPLATVAGLRYALKAIAAKMQIDRDILFLSLSSHGSDDPSISVSNGAMPLRDLSGDLLAEALQQSGIKWRVIMISACHAGAFIKPLQDAHTIVITAAAPDRSSFGCSDERDLTYFGEAFYRDSVLHAASLRSAFDATKTLIEEREKAEGVKASNPQAFFGEEMERRLATLEQTIRRSGGVSAER
jgi:hypothetical protein